MAQATLELATVSQALAEATLELAMAGGYPGVGYAGLGYGAGYGCGGCGAVIAVAPAFYPAAVNYGYRGCGC